MKTKTVDVAVDGKIGKNFKGILKDALGIVLPNKEILISYNGKTYKKTTDKNGAFKFQLNIKKAGSYSISTYYLGDNIYKASYAAAKITVTKQTPKIIAKKATYKVKTKKIICYSNVIASSINIAEVVGLKTYCLADVGGVVNTIYELVTSMKFQKKVQRDFIFGTYNKALAQL